MNSHKDLEVWQKSMDFAIVMYRLTERFPQEERFGLLSQIRRAAVSIPSNISEGAARNSKKEFVQFLYIALGSASELETQLLIAKKLAYLEDESAVIDDLLSIQRMLMGLIKYLRSRNVVKQ